MKREMPYAFQKTSEILAESRTTGRRGGVPHRALPAVVAELQAALVWERFGRGRCSAREVPEGAREAHGVLRRICGGCASVQALDVFWARVRTAVVTLGALNDVTAAFPDRSAIAEAHNLCYAVAAYLIQVDGGRAMRAAQSPPE